MKLITFYADCDLPQGPKANQAGFDWRRAIELLRKSGERFGYDTVVVTDEKTKMPGAWLRVGDARRGLMMWLLETQAAAADAFTGEKAVLVSPDTLIAGPLDFLFGDWDLTLLTRTKPKPIVNSVIAFRPSEAVSAIWAQAVEVAQGLPPESKEWGADIDALVNVIGIQPQENSVREVSGAKVKLMPLSGKFESAKFNVKPHMLRSPIWDFKGARKSLMTEYAKVLGC